MTKEKIDVKIGTKDEVLWTEVKQKTQILIEAFEKDLKINKQILKLAEKKIKAEKEKNE